MNNLGPKDVKLFIGGQPVDGFTAGGMTDRALLVKPEKGEEPPLGSFTISVDWLIDHDACHEGIARFAEQCGVEYEDKDSGFSGYYKEFDILSLVDGANDNGDLLWLASELVSSGMLEFAHVMDFINAAGKIAVQAIRDAVPATKYPHLEKVFESGVIDDNCWDTVSYARFNALHNVQTAARLVWCLVRSLELKDLWLGGDEFEKAGFPQAEFNRLMTELLGHAKPQ